METRHPRGKCPPQSSVVLVIFRQSMLISHKRFFLHHLFLKKEMFVHERHFVMRRHGTLLILSHKKEEKKGNLSDL